MRCDEMRGALDAYLDEELTPLEIARVQEHLAACNTCRVALERAAGLHSALTADALIDAPPETLRRRIVERATEEAASMDRSRFAAWPRRGLVTLAGAMTVVAGVVLVLLVALRPAAGPTASAFIPLHRELVEPAALPLSELTSGADLQGWLGHHMGAGLGVPPRTADGESLVGGRKSVVGGQPVIQLVYQGDGRRLSLFIARGSLRRQPDEVEHVIDRVEVYTSEVAGSRIGWWLDGNHVYVAIGAVETSDILDLALLCAQSRRGGPRASGSG